jgi:hypothetical protein
LGRSNGNGREKENERRKKKKTRTRGSARERERKKREKDAADLLCAALTPISISQKSVNIYTCKERAKSMPVRDFNIASLCGFLH